MKTLLQISYLLGLLCALGLVFGNNEGTYPIVTRFVFGVLLSLFILLARGIEKRKMYGWWSGTFLLWLVPVGFLANILHLKNEEDIFFVLWVILSQVLCALIAVMVFFRKWKRKKASYFQVLEENTEPVAGGDATRWRS